jgi:hypothetical protein
VALILTFVGSWSCNYFHGADIGFTGGSYGIWTIEDIDGKCQLWDILFFSYHLDGHLEAARFFSMMAMIVGLSMLATMAQAQQAHVVSWGILLAFAILFLVSVLTTSTYNIWILFGLLSYLILTLIVRSLFIHPVHRRISARGSMCIGYLFLFCFATTLLTLIILRSDYCTCESLSTNRLEREIIGDPCEGDCTFGSGGVVMMAASLFWLVTAVATFKIGVQPEEIMENPSKRGIRYEGYSRESITTKAFNFGRGVARGGRKNEVQSERKSTDDDTDMVRPLEEDAGEVNSAGAVNEGEIEVENNDNDIDIDQNNIKEDERVRPQEEDTGEVNSAGAVNEGEIEVENNDNDIAIDQNNIEEDERVRPQEEDTGEVNEGEIEVENKDNDNDIDQNNIEEDETWHRTWCQKLCCDFRVTERSRKERWQYWSFRTLLGFLLGMYLFLIILLAGSRVENRRAEKAPSTTPFFVTDIVCAFDEANTSAPFVTFPTAAAANLAGLKVAHCGHCGACSNIKDIETYVETRETIADSAKRCGAKAVIGKYKDLVKCLEDRIGFSRTCTFVSSCSIAVAFVILL